jgi:ribosomal protein S18 acetylase RimI-like enzyme
MPPKSGKVEVQMIRCAEHKDVASIQAVLNDVSNWGKLEAYPDKVIRDAIDDQQMPILVWEENGQWGGFCWLRRTNEGTKIEEFGVSRPGCGIGSRFFKAILERVSQDRFEQPLWLAVATDNVDAIRFYVRFGFVGGELKKAAWKRRAGPVADALIMTHSSNDEASDVPRGKVVT